MTAIENLINRLTSPYNKEATSNNFKLLKLSADEYDEISTVIADIRKAHVINQSTGINLEYLGALLQTFRETGETDAHYRARLKTMWQRYVGSGTIQDMLNIVAAMLSVDTSRVELTEDFVGKYATFEMKVWAEDLASAGVTVTELRDLIDNVKGAGISVTAQALGTFEARAAADPNDSTKGYDDIAHSNPNGGTYSSLF